MSVHEIVQRVEKYYAGPMKARKRLVRKKWRCSCGFSTHSTAKMNAHIKKWA